MISREGNLLRITTAMTMETVGALLGAGAALFNSSECEFDLAAVKDVDSAALALMFEWLRLAQASNTALFFSNLPKSLISLAVLYGVLDMIPQRAVSNH